MSAKIDLFGVEELNRFFEDMKRADQRKLIQNAFKIGSKPIIEVSRAYLKSRRKSKATGSILNKSIGFVPLRSARHSVFASAKVGARRFGIYKGYHGHLFDAGTKQRQTKKGINRGSMPATHFFTDTLKDATPRLQYNSAESYLKAMDKLIARKLKKVSPPA